MWVALILIEGGVALAVRVPVDAHPAAAESVSALDGEYIEQRPGAKQDPLPPEFQAAREAFQVHARQEADRVGGFQSFINLFAAPLWQSVTETFLSPEFFLLLAAVTVFFYGLPLGLLTLTVLWIVARRRHGGHRAPTLS